MFIFKTWKEAQEEYYKHYDCLSDDSDKENHRIEVWMELFGHELREEEYTKSEWEEKNKFNPVSLEIENVSIKDKDGNELHTSREDTITEAQRLVSERD